MKHKQIMSAAASSLAMLILILDGKTALEGARAGVGLCLNTVLPSLFPFFVLSIFLTGALTGASLPFTYLITKIFQIPRGAESILISGFLGGYPVGAQCISISYCTGQLHQQEAERMLAFCNNAGPAFLFGMVSQMFPHIGYTWALWGIHVISATLVALLLPSQDSNPINQSSNVQISLPHALQTAIRTTASVCGWVILFRVILAFLNRWILWLLPVEAQVIVTGILELSNGCCELRYISDLSKRFLICSGILSMGGICVTMQTQSVTKGLSLHLYFLGKFLQTTFSLLICTVFLYQAWIPIFLIPITFLWKTQKKSSIRKAVGV